MKTFRNVLILVLINYVPNILSNPIERIVNGELVDITEVPYQAALRRKTTSGWRHSCGAVVISTNSVLTAAHCIVNYQDDPSQLKVAVGTSMRSGGIVHNVYQIYSHKEYSRVTVDNDVGVVSIIGKFTFSQSVKAIKVASFGLQIPVGTQAIVSGFGRTEDAGETSDLRAAAVNIVSEEKCALAYRNIGAITTGMICASGKNPPRDACQGDSGGPLVLGNTVIGIVSWGEGCANTSYPGVYTKVSKYSDWIQDKLTTITSVL